MQRIDTPNRALNLWGAGKDGWKDGNQSAGINATELDAAFFNAVQEELAAVVEYVGLALDPNNRAQVLAAILNLIEARAGNYALDTGVANAYVIALNPAVAVINGDYSFRVKIVHANTGASTVDFGAGPVPLVNDLGGALAANDVAGGNVISVSYIHADNKAYITSLVPSQAISQANADARYAALAGLATEIFSVANASAAMHAVNLQTGDGRYAALAGLATQLFSVANATAASHAINLGQAFGIGQTLTDVHASRALNTTYTNSRTKPIVVIINASSSSSPAGSATVYGVSIQGYAAVPVGTAVSGYAYAQFAFVVEPGQTYLVTSISGGASAPSVWSEMY